MKLKILLSAILSLLIFASVCGCGKNDITPKDITSALLKSEAFTDSEKYIALDEEQVESYFGFDEELDDFSVFISSAEEDDTELGAFELDDPDDRNIVIDGINRYRSVIADAFLVMNSENSFSSQKLLLMELDDIIIYVISDNIDAAEQTLSGLGATEIN